jgi:anti-sigma B factor antagonist
VIAMSGTAPVASADGGPTVVRLPAEIDVANAQIVGGQLAAACRRGVRVVIADMTATTFCDSQGIRALVMAWRQATATGTELRLVVPSPGIVRIMNILGVDRVLLLYGSLDEALAGPAAPPVSEPAPA